MNDAPSFKSSGIQMRICKTHQHHSLLFHSSGLQKPGCSNRNTDYSKQPFLCKTQKNMLHCAEFSSHCCSSELPIYLPLSQTAVGCNASHISHFAQPFIASLSFMGLIKTTILEKLMVSNDFDPSFNPSLFWLQSQLLPIFFMLLCCQMAFFFFEFMLL